MHIKPKKALQIALKQKGAPARELFSEADWNDIERTMSIELMALYQAAHAAKRELAQIFMGRPIE